MVNEEYCSFGTAKLLKEKGFDEPCYMSYHETNKDYEIGHDAGHTNSMFEEFYKKDGVMNYSAPTLQMAMRWLREVHNLYLQIMLDSWALGSHSGYYVVIQRIDSDCEMMLQDALDEVFYKTYEEACEAAIKYCLENLI